ncbi:MAG: hypothetical protein LBM09_00495 [Candidatus Nomurabacteria bacterium]|jgi:hypothetical protein|nr:hypothetical protein [Candidatus Nomurabacteria bacterium]
MIVIEGVWLWVGFAFIVLALIAFVVFMVDSSKNKPKMQFTELGGVRHGRHSANTSLEDLKYKGANYSEVRSVNVKKGKK